MNRLSLLRAEYIQRRQGDEGDALQPRIIARGVGSRENIVGTGSDNVVDALDRRVEFQVPAC
jgi:outer membrane protein OmpA-like peptidoglycan-associated protein